MDGESQFSLSELEARSGVPARTIRFYIARGLLDGPARAGRGAYYTTAHLRRIEWIREQQSQGAMLAEIAVKLRPAPEGQRLAQPEAWLQYSLSEDVRVMVRDGASPWRIRQIRAALSELAGRLSNTDVETRSPDGDRNK
ncbi:MAG: MerR family transcriptional regulator [Acidobacteria bacterium]|nr:MerR family transcriptional regulator [Acidobacteriota bacterium]